MGRLGKLKVKKKNLESDSWDKLKSAPKKPKRANKTNFEKSGKFQANNLESKRLSKKQRETIKRRLRRKNQKVCFACRNTGHILFECPFKKEIDSKVEDNICYICGSPEHSSNKCHLKIKTGEDDMFQFANCFICKKSGHISRQCPLNTNGIYPQGGTCKLCGSKEHLKGHCPIRKGQKGMDTDEVLERDEGESRDVIESDTNLGICSRPPEKVCKVVYF